MTVIVIRGADEIGEFLVVTPTGDTKSFLIDASDAHFLTGREWKIHWSVKGACYYVLRSDPGHSILLHRRIMGEPVGMTVDHRDGDKMLNRKFNLRVCTDAQNQKNRRPKRISPTGLRGVYPTKSGRYTVIVTIDRKAKCYGTFDDPIEAAKLRDSIVFSAFGEFAALNFPKANGV